VKIACILCDEGTHGTLCNRTR